MKITCLHTAKVKWPVSAALVMACCALPVAARHHSPPAAQDDEQLIATECSPLLETASARRAMQLVRAQLVAQGMQLVVQACPFVRVAAGQMRQVVDVRVLVSNSEVAADFVRGPLADGEEVDMGGVHFAMPAVANGWTQEGAQAPDEDVSPDVLFNREWLKKVMQNRGLQAVAGYWWAFVPA